MHDPQDQNKTIIAHIEPHPGEAEAESTAPEESAEQTERLPSVKPVREVPQPRIAHYQLEREVGRGGMGIVWQAWDPVLERRLAIKVLRDTVASSESATERFLTEARIHAKLEHPGIVPVHEQGCTVEGLPYFAMKLVEGQTLERLLEGRPGPEHDLPRYLKIFEQVCQTLGYAHSKGVIHRDLKPANIMVGSFGEVQLMDWGIAKLLHESSPEAAAHPSPPPPLQEKLTHAGDVMGTPAYMAPEQARGGNTPIDARVDVFALGAVLCVILTGEPPYTGWKPYDQAVEGDLRGARDRLEASGSDPELIQLTLRCLAPDPQLRPTDAGAVAQALTRYLEGVQQRLQAAELAAAHARERTVAERLRRKLAVGLIGVLLMLVLVVASGTFWWLSEKTLLERQQAAALATQERAQLREARLIQDVTIELARASVFRQQREFHRAEAALQKAEGRLGLYPPKKLRRQVDRAQADLDLVRRLEGVRNQRGHQTKVTLKAYEQIFAELGLQFDQVAHATLVARLRASPLCEHILAALDDYAMILHTTFQAEGHRLRDCIHAVLHEVDPGPWRDRIRNTAIWEQKEPLSELGKAVDLDQISLHLFSVLAARIHDTKGDLEPVLSRGLERYPDDYWLNWSMGTYLMVVKGDLREALGYLRVTRALRPEFGQAYFSLGEALAQLGRCHEAIDIIQQGLRYTPQDPFALANLCFCGSLTKQWSLVIQAGRELLRLNPADAEIRIHVAMALLETEQWHACIDVAQRVPREDRFWAEACYRIGLAYQHLGAYSEALWQFDQLRDERGYHAKACFGLGACHLALHEPAEAIHWVRAGLAKQPEAIRGRHLLALALRQQGRHEEAWQALRQALKQAPDHPVLQIRRIVWLLEEDQLVEAQTAVYRLQADPQTPASIDPFCEYWLRVCQRRLRAKSAWERGLAESPLASPRETLEVAAWLTAAQQDLATAVELFRKGFARLSANQTIGDQARWHGIAALAFGQLAHTTDPTHRCALRRQALEEMARAVASWQCQPIWTPADWVEMHQILADWRDQGPQTIWELAMLPAAEQAEWLRLQTRFHAFTPRFRLPSF